MSLLRNAGPAFDAVEEERGDPRAFLAMLDQLTTDEFGIGFVYSVLTLLAGQYGLTDAVVVLGDDELGTQAFRLDRKPLRSDSPAGAATTPGVFAEPDLVPHAVQDVVQSVCQLALTLHVARHGTEHDRLTNIANQQYFETTLRTAAVQSARYGWKFTLVLAHVKGYRAASEKAGHSISDDLLRAFGAALRQAVRSGDTAARVSGDEFGVILWNAERAEVAAFLERLRTLPVAGADHIEFSIGTATSPRDSTDPDELSRIAAARLSEKKGAIH